MPQRLESLDWLRGLMALSIMLYHFGGKPDAATMLGRLGMYGVSIFFILSGLSMAIAYDRYIKDAGSSAKFFVRRLFRIWPLLWLAIALVAIPAYVAGNPYSSTTLALNLTTLFGFVDPGNYINMGAWSIGNEMVYYALTPVFILAYQRKHLGNALTLMSVGAGLAFAFYFLDPSFTLEKQWTMYINPFNNLYLYAAGLAMYYNCKDVQVRPRWQLPVFVGAIAVFFLYPASGDQINIATGVNRVALSCIALAIVFAFYKCAPVLPRFFGSKLEQLGIATYGIYLLHPIVMAFVRSTLATLGLHNKFLSPIFAIVLTIIVALLTYRFFELPLTRLGKRVTGPAQERDGKPGPVSPASNNV